jgi:glycosyltransferase involved in cell wall biosynthesis
MQLRVLLASWAPFHAGAEVAAERLAIGLREAGHCVTVVLATRGETLHRMLAADIDVRCLPLTLTNRYRWWRYYRAQHELCRVLHEIRPDVVHANDLPTSQMVGQAAARLGIPRVCHHRWVFSGPATDWLNKFGAERHIFVSKPLMDEMCSNSARLRASPRAVVHDCIPLPPMPSDADRASARQKLGLSPDRQLVLFTGQMIERKGIEDLLRAWRELITSGLSGADLLFVGEDLENNGAYRRRMEQLSIQLDVRAKFVGFQRNVFEWIVASDVCVAPSHAEPFGLTVLEAMAHARPVVGSNVGGIPEMIVEAETGLLVPPQSPHRLATAIAALLQDPALGMRLGLAGRERCQMRFSLSSHIDAIVNQYRHSLAPCAAVGA